MFFGEEAEVGAGGPGGPGAGGAEVGGAGAGGEAPAPPPAAARVRENEYYLTPQIKMPVQMAMPAASKCQERGLVKMEEDMAPYPPDAPDAFLKVEKPRTVSNKASGVQRRA